jgi:hypothetical protein
MNELKLYHRIGNFSIQVQLLIINMLRKLYPDLWPLTDRNIVYLVDLMEDCRSSDVFLAVAIIKQRLHVQYFLNLPMHTRS